MRKRYSKENASNKKQCYRIINRFRLSLTELQQLSIEIQRATDYLSEKRKPYINQLNELDERKRRLIENNENLRQEAGKLFDEARKLEGQSVGIIGSIFGNEKSRLRDQLVEKLRSRACEICTKKDEKWLSETRKIQEEKDDLLSKLASVTWEHADVRLLKKEMILDGYSTKLGDVFSYFASPPDRDAVMAIEQLINEQKKKNELHHLKARASSTTKEARQAAIAIKKQIAHQFKLLKICPYCGEPLNISSAHADHIYPISKGGHSTIINMVYICADCNVKKSSNTLNQFIRKTGYRRQDIERRLELLNKDY